MRTSNGRRTECGTVSGRWVVRYARGGAEELAAQVKAVDAVVRDGEMLKDGDRSTVVRIGRYVKDRGEVNGEWVTLKRYNLKGAGHSAVHGVMRSRAEWCRRNAGVLERAGVRTPRVLCVLEERVMGIFRGRSALVSEYVEGRSLKDLVESGELAGERLRRVAEEMGEAWRKLGELQAGHGDMKATNFLVDGALRVWLIDLDGMRTGRSGVMLRREREQDYGRFMRNWEGHAEAREAFGLQMGQADG